MDDTQRYLVVDAIRVPEAAPLCARENIEYGKLYLGTPWQAQIDNSPLWIGFRENDAVWQQWQSDKRWADSSLCFEFDSMLSQSDVIASLQQHITITSEDGRLLLFRFYSPKTLINILPHLDSAQISALCGLACELRFSPLVPGAEALSPLTNPSDSPTLTPLMISKALAEELLS
ncbi:DUF4123 domain-containing protein [Vibrio spartinae]|uniref:DUF4123 domain-containing protein n=1 Tax=Vibrio spartinae TaxID=1918945 RepID=A0ABX6R7T5_9VIBR|nr:DUF4123 domain-containing protein [Vibrio spartinae]QMV17030.1 hypothetical protein Vspart_04455 [Vibrio spartinae]